MVRLSDGNYVNAVTHQWSVGSTSIYVSPNVALNYSDIHFGSIMAHEMTHVWQFSIMYSGYAADVQRESPSYLNETRYLLNHGSFNDAFILRMRAAEYGYTGMSKWFLYFQF